MVTNKYTVWIQLQGTRCTVDGTVLWTHEGQWTCHRLADQQTDKFSRHWHPWTKEGCRKSKAAKRANIFHAHPNVKHYLSHVTTLQQTKHITVRIKHGSYCLPLLGHLLACMSTHWRPPCHLFITPQTTSSLATALIYTKCQNCSQQETVNFLKSE